MGHGVEFGRTYVAKTTVDSPHPYPLRHLFLTFHGVTFVGIEVLVAIFIILIDIAIGIHLIIHLSLHTTGHAEHEKQQ